MKVWQGMLAGIMLVLAGCGSSEKAAEKNAVVPAEAVRLSAQEMTAWQGKDSAAASCTLAGGKIGLARQLNGASVGTCLLTNGRRCDAQSLEDGSCLAGGLR
ncbi:MULTISPECIES: putative hemolysin [Lonsdalea]|nr:MULTISPECIES: DUF333 domain-containing protein [Lonsdalea]QPQ25570.1 DUF333 domain-containing protein [Lonsdalea populi]ROH82286.1 DUF333 domain-containing protein [Lonsdalea populi]ROH84697.1 DUF333 domain-containing protein [Lonsdalea populi]ROH85034.1 DUF333 domain-containing protein [Lonsdalea populi]